MIESLGFLIGFVGCGTVMSIMFIRVYQLHNKSSKNHILDSDVKLSSES